MSNTKTEAQRLAALLDHGNDTSQIEREVINELHRLDAHNKAMHKIIDQLRAQLAKAVAEEREACAKVCDDRYGELFEPEAQELAAAIRARSNK